MNETPVDVAAEQSETPRLDRSLIYMLKGIVAVSVSILGVAVILLCLAAFRAAWELVF
jgi:hypothetical protein